MESWQMTCGAGNEKGIYLLVPERVDGASREGRVAAL